MLRPTTTCLIILLLAAISSAGCDGGSSSSSATSSESQAVEPVRIIATTYALGDLARQVGGKYVEVEWVIESGQSMVGFEPSPSLRERLGRADLILAGGMDESWAVGEAASSFTPHRFLRLDMLSVPPASLPAEAGTDVAAGVRWLDPLALNAAAKTLAQSLVTLRPRHDVYFRARAEGFENELNLLVDDFADHFARQPRRRVLAMNYEFDGLAGRMGVNVTHPTVATADRVTDEQVRAFRNAARQEHLPVLLVRIDTPPALIADLSEKTGTRIFALDAFGSSAPGSGRASVQELLKYNLTQLLDAVKAGQ